MKDEHRSAGDLLLLNPGDSHACKQCGGETLDYRSLTITQNVMRSLSEEITGTDTLPRFSPHILRDSEAACDFRALHELVLSRSREFEKEEALPPLYQAVSNLSVLFILYFGARNVLGTGWRAWDIAAFTTFLSCFMKMSVKSSKAAPGEIIGITGPVACGKSTLGRVFLYEQPYGGSVMIGGRELSEFAPREVAAAVGYLGHDPELWNDTVRANVLCGADGDAMDCLKLTALDGEVHAMEQRLDTVVGSSGVRLSGGQAQRLALARTLAHPRPILVLDDPFSALDRATEDAVFANLKTYARDKVIFLISHRLYHFPEMQKIVFMEDGKAIVGTHEELLAHSAAYRVLYESQTGGDEHEA